MFDSRFSLLTQKLLFYDRRLTTPGSSTIPRFLNIPDGDFLMGQEDGRDDEKPVHLVRVSGFALGETQITNAQYDRFCAATGRGPTKFRTQPGFDHPDQPVTGPSWFDCVDYCEWLSGELSCHCRLPTEAEWEWAARGGMSQCLFPWGNAAVEDRADYHRRWLTGPERVGTAAPNAYGLYDICENVHEWCSDWYERDYYALSPVENPQGPESGNRRASRGGSWRHQIKISRCAGRSSIPPTFEYADYGFRVAANST